MSVSGQGERPYTNEDLNKGAKRRRGIGKENAGAAVKAYTPKGNAIHGMLQVSAPANCPNLGRLRNPTNKRSPLSALTSPPTPLSPPTNSNASRDCGNLLMSKKQRTRKNISPPRQLFQDNVQSSDTPTPNYENIEHSLFDGCSDSEDDAEVSDVEDDPSRTYKEIPLTTGSLHDVAADDSSWAHKKMEDVPPEYVSLGGPMATCSKCGAQMWKEERTNKKVNKRTPFRAVS